MELTPQRLTLSALTANKGITPSPSPPQLASSTLQGQVSASGDLAPILTLAPSDRVTFGQLTRPQRQALFYDSPMNVSDQPDYIKAGLQMAIGLGVFVLGVSMKVASCGLLVLPALYVDTLGVHYMFRGVDTLNDKNLPKANSRNEALRILVNSETRAGSNYISLAEDQPRLQGLYDRYLSAEPNSSKTKLIALKLNATNLALDMIEGNEGVAGDLGGVSKRYPNKLRVRKKDLAKIMGVSYTNHPVKKILSVLAAPMDVLDGMLFKGNLATVDDVVTLTHRLMYEAIKKEPALKIADRALFDTEGDWMLGLGSYERNAGRGDAR
jgi:hypothetical protein